jgi:hypothetical protein
MSRLISSFRRTDFNFYEGFENGGPERDRTDDIQLAKLALYQLSYGPTFSNQRAFLFIQNRGDWQYLS